MTDILNIIQAHLDGKQRIGERFVLQLENYTDLAGLCNLASQVRDRGFGSTITYSPKVFIPLTRLCRDVCHYCTFATSPKRLDRVYMTPEEAIAIARKGVEAGCHEALFTLGDKPEDRYPVAKQELNRLGFVSTIAYLAYVARRVFEETGLLPHLNAGVLNAEDLALLRGVSVSQGLMLESTAAHLSKKGGPHYGSPDKEPSVRLDTIRQAVQQKIPFTSGILIGIGESKRERIESLLALRDIHEKYGGLQEVIIQSFRRKEGTRMANAPEPDEDDLLWTVAVARLVFGLEVSIQAPPNLTLKSVKKLLQAGVNDFGGISPVTPDHVNPEAPWPHLALLAREVAVEGRHLAPRPALYPAYVLDMASWVDPIFHSALREKVDGQAFLRENDWTPGSGGNIPVLPIFDQAHILSSPLDISLNRACAGQRLNEADIVALFSARGHDFVKVCRTADELRAEVRGETVSFVVNRNINYTNICGYGCSFCAFSKGPKDKRQREKPYNLPLAEIKARTLEARDRGAGEVCLQGGIHPKYTGQTYLDIVRSVKEACPDMHVHAFSPLEIWHGATSLNLPLDEFLQQLKVAGLGSLPGTAAEILDNDVRKILCPDKITTEQWVAVIRAAHSCDIPTTSTIMFGHVDGYHHWARHLQILRDIQAETGGFTEFVPLPYVHMEAPLYGRGACRKGPTFRETVLMHAVSRLVLHTRIENIQTSWTKMGRRGALACLQAGANDMGGILMDESISRAAGASHGQELPVMEMKHLIRSIGRLPRQRDSLYQFQDQERSENTAAG